MGALFRRVANTVGHIERILLFAKPSIGDVLLATPLFRALRRAYPAATIDALVFRGHGPVLDGNPDIDHVISVAKRPAAAEYAALVRRIGRRYDLALSTSTSDRAYIYLLLAAPHRLAVLPPNKALKSRAVRAGPLSDDVGTHTVVQNNLLGAFLGLPRCYEVVPPRDADAANALTRLLPGIWNEAPYAVLHLSPGLAYKRWSAAGWATIAHHLVQAGLHVVLTGADSEPEAAYVHSVQSEMPDTVVSLVGKVPLGVVTTLLERCSVYVGPDTLLTHLAASVGAPTVALFGPTNPVQWAPWPKGYASDAPPFPRKGSARVGNVFLLQGPGDCVPCHRMGCAHRRDSHSDCLDALAADTVLRAVEEMRAAPAVGSR